MPKNVTPKEIETGLSEEQIARLKEQSGTASGGVRLPVLNRISLNGNCDAVEDESGKLIRPPVNYRMMMLKTVEKDQKPENINLGSPIEVIFIKIRRRLVERDSNGFQVRSSTQHAHKDQVVTLWEGGKLIASGKASALREQYKDLRTIQEIYVIYKGELCLLTVKGASLGSETRNPKLPSFYEYLQIISGDGIFSHVTILNGVIEKGKKDFYTMTFEKGRPTTVSEQIDVLKYSDELTALITKYDAENSRKQDIHPDELKTDVDKDFDSINEEKEEIPF